MKINLFGKGKDVGVVKPKEGKVQKKDVKKAPDKAPKDGFVKGEKAEKKGFISGGLKRFAGKAAKGAVKAAGAVGLLTGGAILGVGCLALGTAAFPGVAGAAVGVGLAGVTGYTVAEGLRRLSTGKSPGPEAKFTDKTRDVTVKGAALGSAIAGTAGVAGTVAAGTLLAISAPIVAAGAAVAAGTAAGALTGYGIYKVLKGMGENRAAKQAKNNKPKPPQQLELFPDFPKPNAEAVKEPTPLPQKKRMGFVDFGMKGGLIGAWQRKRNAKKEFTPANTKPVNNVDGWNVS